MPTLSQEIDICQCLGHTGQVTAPAASAALPLTEDCCTPLLREPLTPGQAADHFPPPEDPGRRRHLRPRQARRLGLLLAAPPGPSGTGRHPERHRPAPQPGPLAHTGLACGPRAVPLASLESRTPGDGQTRIAGKRGVPFGTRAPEVHGASPCLVELRMPAGSAKPGLWAEPQPGVLGQPVRHGRRLLPEPVHAPSHAGAPKTWR